MRQNPGGSLAQQRLGSRRLTSSAQRDALGEFRFADAPVIGREAFAAGGQPNETFVLRERLAKQRDRGGKIASGVQGRGDQFEQRSPKASAEAVIAVRDGF